MAVDKNTIASFFTSNPNLWSEEIVLPRSAFIIRSGEIERHLYFIKEGAVRVFFESESSEHCIRLGYKNNLINALPSFLSEKPSILNIQTLKKTVFVRATKTALLNERDASTENLQMWVAMLENLFLQQFEREVDLLTVSPEERYNRVLKRSPQLFQEIPAKYIADYLRMTPETLSRLKKS